MIGAAINGKWFALGGASGFLGAPHTDETVCPDHVGHFVHFAGGSIYWTPGTGPWSVHGSIRGKWATLGWERCAFLGYPVTDENGCPDGVGRYNHFQQGSIYWTAATGAWSVHGSIRNKWAALGWERCAFLGYPVTDENGCPDGVGRYNHFQQGSIYWTAATGAWSVHGSIRNKWASLGWERCAFLGYPVTDENGCPDGVGRYNHFQQGSIYWTAATGAWSVHGSIRNKWASLGWERCAFLGYPVTDENGCPDGVGRYNHFQNGSIYWTQATGAWSVHGLIRDKWASLGWERCAFLGYLLTDESACPDGVGRYNHFQHGSIYWTPATGAWSVHGSIRDTWASLGWERSALGYPVSDEHDLPGGGRVSNFQHGSINWTASRGTWVTGLDDKLAFTMQQQQQGNWCWAATSASIAVWYGTTTWAQCAIANAQLARTDCCGTGASGACNVYGFLDGALTTVGHLNHADGGTATYEQVEGEVVGNRPLGIRVAWSGGGAHFIAATGTEHDASVWVSDCGSGTTSLVAYDTLRTAYNGSGTWTDTFYTKA